MKSKLFVYLILIFAFNSTVVAQSSVRKSLNYQAVILDPKPVEIPGRSLVNQPLFKAEVCLKFALLNGQSGATDYEETQQVTTDEYGLISVSIGNGMSTGQGTFKTFDSIKWDAAIKSLKVSVSFDACTNYKAVSTQLLNYSPYALYAESTEYANVRGVPTKLSQFQNDFGFLVLKDLDPLNNALIQTNQTIENNKIIADNNFLVSTKSIDTLRNAVAAMSGQLAEQSNRIVDVHSLANNAQKSADHAFDIANSTSIQLANIQNLLASQNANAEQIANKSISVTVDGTSDIKYPSVKAVKDYVDGQVTSGISGATTPDATTTTLGKIQLAGDLSGTASSPTVPALAFKANLSSPALTGTPTAPTATAGNNSTQIANTSFVVTELAALAIPVSSTVSGMVNNVANQELGGVNKNINGISIGRGAGNNISNHALGFLALSSNTTGIRNLATGYLSLYSNTTGDNNQAIGYQALFSNTTGFQNHAFGYQTLFSNTTGLNNQAFGFQALNSNTTGSINQAFGYHSLKNNTTGTRNTASGYQSLFSNTTGADNQASGYMSLYFNTLGSRNQASGFQALFQNTTGDENFALGYQALQSNTTGFGNYASGYQALKFNSTGNQNIAVGGQALFYNTTGSNNIGLGFQAGYLTAATTGNNNIYIGNLALPSAAVDNEIVIGYNTVGRGQNTVAIGNSATTNNYFYGAIDATAFNVTSDQRLKTNIEPLTNANQLINQLVPVSYDKKINLADTTYSVMDEYGFIAQEVQKVLPAVISQGKGKDGLLSINYTSLIPLLTKALQEQGHENQQLKQQISEQAKRIQALEKSLAKLLGK
jgi:hypothetical protein